jgi:hypothetical protein
MLLLPCLSRTTRSRVPISLSAVPHEIRSKLPSGVRRSGCVTRSGSFCTSAIAIPFGHAKPWEIGWAASGRMRVAFPSSTGHR